MRPDSLAKTGLSRIAIVFALLFASRAASADVLKIVVNDTIHRVVAERVDWAVQGRSERMPTRFLSNCARPAD